MAKTLRSMCIMCGVCFLACGLLSMAAEANGSLGKYWIVRNAQEAMGLFVIAGLALVILDDRYNKLHRRP